MLSEALEYSRKEQQIEHRLKIAERISTVLSANAVIGVVAFLGDTAAAALQHHGLDPIAGVAAADVAASLLLDVPVHSYRRSQGGDC